MTNSLSTLPADLSRSRVLNTTEAAAFLGFSVVHFRRLYRAGTVPKPLQIGTRKLGWKAGDLADFVAGKTCTRIAA